MRISDWSSDVCSSDLDNKASRSHTVIEVNGRDRPGLLYLVTTTLTRLNLMIKSARIATYGERADLIIRRSEEHTSELQSLMRISYAVFCLKKKKSRIQTSTV